MVYDCFTHIVHNLFETAKTRDSYVQLQFVWEDQWKETRLIGSSFSHFSLSSFLQGVNWRVLSWHTCMWISSSSSNWGLWRRSILHQLRTDGGDPGGSSSKDVLSESWGQQKIVRLEASLAHHYRPKQSSAGRRFLKICKNSTCLASHNPQVWVISWLQRPVCWCDCCQGWRVAFIGIGSLSVLVGIFAARFWDATEIRRSEVHDVLVPSGATFSCWVLISAIVDCTLRKGLHHDGASTRDIWGTRQGLLNVPLTCIGHLRAWFRPNTPTGHLLSPGSEQGQRDNCRIVDLVVPGHQMSEKVLGYCWRCWFLTNIILQDRGAMRPRSVTNVVGNVAQSWTKCWCWTYRALRTQWKLCCIKPCQARTAEAAELFPHAHLLCSLPQ